MSTERFDRRAISLAVVWLFLPAIDTIAQEELANLGFEDGSAGWTSAGEGYTFEIDGAVACEGTRSARISAPEGTTNWGGWMRRPEAGPLLGRRVELRIHFRTTGFAPGSAAALWVRADGPDGTMLAFDNSAEDDPITADLDWTPRRIACEIPEGAAHVAFGFYLAGAGTLWADALSIESSEIPRPDAYEASQDPLSRAATKRLALLARAWGSLRFFDPALELDPETVDAVLPALVRKVEEGAGLEALDELGRSLGASVRFVADGGTGAAPRLVGDILDLRGTSGRHGVAAETERLLASVLSNDLPLPSRRDVSYRGFPCSAMMMAPYSTDRTVTEVQHLAASVGGGGTFRVRVDASTAPESALYAIALARAGLATIEGNAPGVPGSGPARRIELDAEASTYLPEWAAWAVAGVPRLGNLRAVPEKPYARADWRSVRLAAVIEAWNVLAHFYPYWEGLEVEPEALLVDLLTRMAAAASPDSVALALSHMLARLRDGHGFARVPGALAGSTPPIALVVAENRIVVTASGDERIRAGWAVLSIDGVDALALLEKKLDDTPSGTLAARRMRALGTLLAGPASIPARLVLEDLEGARIELELPRDSIPGALSDLAPHPVLEPRDDGIVYVDLSRIDPAAFQEALPTLVAARGVVFDLRGYPNLIGFAPLSHLTDRPLDSMPMDIPRVRAPDRPRDWERVAWQLPPLEPRITCPVVFITDERAISAAETFLSIVRGNTLAPIVGRATAGTNGNVTMARLPGGSTIHFTAMKVTNHDGSRHHGVGIVPDVPVERTRRGIAAGTDEDLEAALELLDEAPGGK